LVAEGYAEWAPGLMGPFAIRAIELAAPSVSAQVLDVATGSGVLSLQVAKQVNHVDALDFSAEMLGQLEIRRQAQQLQNVRTFQGDGQALPFSDARYDAAFSMFGLMFFPDRAKGFSELFRCLKPAGVAVVSSWAPVSMSPLMTLMFDALRVVDPSRTAPETNFFSLENPELFETELRAAGFLDVSVKPHTNTVVLSSAEEFWETLTRGGAPFVLLRKRLGEAEWQRQSQIAVNYLKTRIVEPTSLSTTAYLGFGRKPA
jgi:ubiquinone/menaquinone biosynthesis C-methylase UbiE